jgi:hypothetical protein
MRKAVELTPDILKKLIHYDPETGVFTRISGGRKCDRGVIAGGFAGAGYLTTTVGGRKYYLSRLAWMYVHGRWPAADIDHVNRNKTDNRLVNLREATRSENLRNVVRWKDNTSGETGIYWNKSKQKWFLRLSVQRKCIWGGMHDTLEQAVAKKQEMVREYYGEFAPNG